MEVSVSEDKIVVTVSESGAAAIGLASDAKDGLMPAAAFRKQRHSNNMIDFVRPDVNVIYTPGPSESVADVIDRCLTGALDCQPAIQALLDLTTIAAPRGKACDLPDGDLRIDRPIRVRRGAILRGQGGAIRAPATRLLPHTNTFSAIVVVSGYTPDPGDGRGGGSYICDLGIDYQGAYAERRASHAYTVGDVMVSGITGDRTIEGVDFHNVISDPAAVNHLCAFVCTQAGTSASGAGPNLSAVVEGATVADGTVVWTATVISALHILERIIAERIYVNGPAGNAATIVCYVPSSNANNFVLRDWRIDSPGGNGVYVESSDTNSGSTSQVDVGAARFWGIFDSSFLGNAHYSPSAAGCLLGPYKADGQVEGTTFYNPYSESGQPPADVSYPSQVIGGTWGAGHTPDSRRQSGNLFQPTIEIRNARDGDGTGVFTTIGGLSGNEDATHNVIASFAQNASGGAVVDTAMALKYRHAGYATGFWRWDIDNFDGYVAMLIATGQQTIFPIGAIAFPRGIAIGDVLNTGFDLAPYIVNGIAAPAAGKWKLGDRVINRAPSELGSSGSKYILDGWICVTAGDFAATPPVFKEQRTLTGG